MLLGFYLYELSSLVLAVQIDGTADGDRVLLEAVIVQARLAVAVHEAKVIYGGEVSFVASRNVLNKMEKYYVLRSCLSKP